MDESLPGKDSTGGQRCDVCGAHDLATLFWVQRRRWDGKGWEPDGMAVCCGALCLFAVAVDPTVHLTPLAAS